MEIFFRETVHPDDLMELQELYIDVVEGTIEEHPKNGEISWIDSHARVRREDGERLLTGISTDITELKRHEQELAAQNERLEELTHILSHDLRNPLNVAEGRIRLAMETGELAHFEGADLALGRMESLISDLLTLSRTAQGSPDAQRDPAQLEPVVLAETATGCWQNVATNGAGLTVETELVVRAYSSKLEQLFESLFRGMQLNMLGQLSLSRSVNSRRDRGSMWPTMGLAFPRRSSRRSSSTGFQRPTRDSG